MTRGPSDKRLTGQISPTAPFAQRTFTGAGKFFCIAGDWEWPLGATVGERDRQATIQLLEDFPVPIRAQL